jgi:hypothetical protein
LAEVVKNENVSNTLIMQTSKLSRAKPVLKYFGVFVLGAIVGGGVVFQFGWGVMAKLMGVDAQKAYRAVDASKDAYWLTSILSHQRLGENDKARERAEWLLDTKTIEAAQWAKETKDARVKKIQSGQLGIVKRYRKMYPSQTEFKSQVGQVLATIPDLPEPKQKLPEEKLTAQGRLYQRHQSQK